MRELTCIVCPNGCKLTVEETGGTEEKAERAERAGGGIPGIEEGQRNRETRGTGNYKVSGNRCKRGERFAVTEMTNPMRTVCSTVRTLCPEAPVLPVRVSEEIPKAMIFPVMEEINKVCLTSPAGRGDVIIKNVLGLSADVIATSNLLKDKWKTDQREA